LKGEYGDTPAARNAELQARVLQGKQPITCRPADLLEPEFESLSTELKDKAQDKGIRLTPDPIDDVLTYALFPQVGLNFLAHRGDPSAFEPAPGSEPAAPAPAAAPVPVAGQGPATYEVKVNGKPFTVEITASGDISQVESQPPSAARTSTVTRATDAVPAMLAGTVFKVLVKPGDAVEPGQPLIVIEAMKMETEVAAPKAGTVAEVFVREGDAISVGDPLITIG
jgi:oxaloacetate decarboxylase alpha subunit